MADTPPLSEAVARLRELAPDAPPVAYDAIDTILTALDQYEAMPDKLTKLADEAKAKATTPMTYLTGRASAYRHAAKLLTPDKEEVR
jgi:hypothetical protein